MNLNADNYFSREANEAYWSVSQFKAFNKCEAAGLAEVRGEFQREETDALLIGGYVDAYFSGERAKFTEQHREQMINKRTGGLLAKFAHAQDLVRRVESDPVMMSFMDGEKQVIFTADLFGVPWKVKLDVYNGNRIVDLKCVRDFEDIFDKGYGWRSWIEYWGYDIQGAVYQRVVKAVTGKQLPFYIVAVTKEKVPDVAVIQIPQHILDGAYGLVTAKIERFDLIKSGDVEPIRCEHCEYCKTTKVLMQPEVYEIEEA